MKIFLIVYSVDYQIDLYLYKTDNPVEMKKLFRCHNKRASEVKTLTQFITDLPNKCMEIMNDMVNRHIDYVIVTGEW